MPTCRVKIIGRSKEIDMRIPLISGFERDVFSGWRAFFCYTSRPGVCRKAKKAYNKRMRQDAKRGVDSLDWMV